jgi:hypothetical protein
VRVEIMGSQKCGIVGKSQPVLIMSHPIIFTRTRTPACNGGRLTSHQPSDLSHCASGDWIEHAIACCLQAAFSSG